VERDPTAYGYNEATRRFELPPSTGRPEISAYGARSTTDLSQFGPRENTINTALQIIDNQIVTRTVTRDDSTGIRLSLPHDPMWGIRGAWNVGLDFKSHLGRTFPSNIFYTTAVSTNNLTGEAIIRQTTTQVASPSSSQDFSYMNLSLGWQGYRPDPQGFFMGSASVGVGSAAAFTPLGDFRRDVGSKDAAQQFVVTRLRIAREQNLPWRMKLAASIDGQLSSQSMVSLEQIGIGGMSSVRGYREGEIYGDDGFFTQVELRSPAFNHEDSFDGKKVLMGTTVSIFSDYGRVYYKQSRGADAKVDLWGAGLGLSSYFTSHVEAKVVLGWALKNSPTRSVGDFLATFVVGAKF
jgi:hemolysin activation/secretion protein